MTDRNIFMKVKKAIYFTLLLLAIIFVGLNSTSVERLIIDNIVTVKAYYLDNTLSFMLFFFITYILLTALSIPMALLMGLSAGFIMDLYIAITLVSFASSIGATLAMLISRYFFYDIVNDRFNKQVQVVKRESEMNGAYYLFALRMSPIFPFFIINASFGLTNIKASVFYLVSQLGMLPATCLIILIGNQLNELVISDSYFSLDLIVYLSLLGLIPLIFKRVFRRI